MPPDQFDRRRVLTFGAATAMGFWAGFGASAAAATGRQPDAKSPPLKFAVTIPGLPEASKSVHALVVDELRVDASGILRRDQETWGRDHEVWNIKPDDVHVGSATFTIAGNPSVFKEVKAWFADAASGKSIRKSITVNLRHPETGAERTYSLSDCFPATWSAVNFDTSSTVQTETLTVRVGRIEFKT
jgi:hypothetical protein